WSQSGANLILTYTVGASDTGGAITIDEAAVKTALGSPKDKAGNVATLPASFATLADPTGKVDTTAPAINSASINSDTTALILTLSETVTGTPDAGDFAVTSGVTGSLTANTVTNVTVNGTQVTLTLTTAVAQNHQVEIIYNQSLDAAKQLKDTAGNLVATVLKTASIVDITAATVANISDTTINNAGTVSVTSNEAGTAYLVLSTLNADAIDSVGELDALVSSTGGVTATKVALTANSAANLTATAMPNGTYNIIVADNAGNLTTASDGTDNSVITVDTTALTLNIADSKTSGIAKAGEEVTYTFTFNKVVTDFAASDITIVNGTIKSGTDLTPASGTNAGKVYTLVIVPEANKANGTNMTVTVDANKATDAAGNANAAVTNTQAIDTVAPSATVA
ncbi:MAG: hypothetical protein FE834_09640, partial [Gammaproteobacteria bacterium]|nr:hypothetical protein [Gammaproteobacteria bacterium]